jgi:MoaD family protein
MPVKNVRVYATLRDLVGGSSIDVALEEGATAQELLDRLVVECPAVKDALLDVEGSLHGHMKMFVNGREVVYLDNGFRHVIQPTDTVDIFPPVGGG